MPHINNQKKDFSDFSPLFFYIWIFYISVIFAILKYDGTGNSIRRIKIKLIKYGIGILLRFKFRLRSLDYDDFKYLREYDYSYSYVYLSYINY